MYSQHSLSQFVFIKKYECEQHAHVNTAKTGVACATRGYLLLTAISLNGSDRCISECVPCIPQEDA